MTTLIAFWEWRLVLVLSAVVGLGVLAWYVMDLVRWYWSRRMRSRSETWGAARYFALPKPRDNYRIGERR